MSDQTFTFLQQRKFTSLSFNKLKSKNFENISSSSRCLIAVSNLLFIFLNVFLLFIFLSTSANATVKSNTKKFSPKKVNWIKCIRIWPSPENTRVVFDLSQPAKYKIITLKSPYRVVIDFEKVKCNVKINDVKLAKTKIKKIRHGIQPNKNLRIVLETDEQFIPNSFTLKPNEVYGHRLVVDLESSEKQEILALFDLDVIDNLDSQSKTDTKTTKTSKTTKTTKSSKIHENTNITNTNSVNTNTLKNKKIIGSKIKNRIHRPGKSNVLAKTKKKKSSILSLRKFNKPKPMDFIIAIDCGHGGEDPGAIGRRGTKEKTVVLAIGRELKKLVNKEKNMRAFLTRNGDYYVGLRQRVIRARKRKADLFISIHADAFKNRSAQGASVFVLSNRRASSEAARWLARKENRADFVGGINIANKNDNVLASVLLDMSQSASKESSFKAARHLLYSLGRVAPLHTRKVENASFAVLKAPDIPSVLVETGFISNPKTELKLRRKSYQKKIAQAIMRGIKGYFRGKTKVSGSIYTKK